MSVSLSYPTGMRKSADVEGLIRMLNISTTIERRDIIQTLGELKSRKSVIPLIELLEDEAMVIRSSAAWALGEVGDTKATLPLIGLLNDESETVRIQSAWALGRFGDMRAVTGLKSLLKDGSPDLKKIAKESLIRIESINDERHQHKYDRKSVHSDQVDIPLLTIDVPSNMFECEYISRVEDGMKKGNGNGNGKGVNFSKDVILDDTKTDYRSAGKNKRRITLGLKNDYDGLASVDVLFNYVDKNNGGHKSSVWLQLATNGQESLINEPGRNYTMPPVPESGWHRDEQIVERRRTPVRDETPPYRQPSREYLRYEHQLPVESGNELRFDTGYSIDPVDEDYPVQKRNGNKEKTERFDFFAESNIAPTISERPPFSEVPAVSEFPPISKAPVISEFPPVSKAPAVSVVPPVTDIHPVSEVSPVLNKPTNMHVVPAPNAETQINIDSAISLLNNIGHSGMANAASTVTELAGQDDSIQSQLRIVQIDDMQNEIIGLGEEIVLIDVGLHGNDPSANISGKLMFYLSKDIALQIANELLCIPQDEAVNEFTEDIISTVKESANIFGGQYVSAISEFIEVPITLNAPVFKTGLSSQIAESNTKEFSGKVEFALTTDMNFGENKTGRLIILLDPKSFDTIIQKLF
jgi:chemotaxis protein CheY-P-specific phosphatase CheC